MKNYELKVLCQDPRDSSDDFISSNLIIALLAESNHRGLNESVFVECLYAIENVTHN